MQSEDRLIHFTTELIHAPRQHTRAALQKLYFELSQTRKAPYDSTDFTQPQAVRFYSKRPPKAQSIALFLPDRIVLVEEWADIALSDYLEKVQEVARRVLADLNVPLFTVQTATIRSTFALTHFDDARVFLLEHVCGQAERLAPHFQRPIETGGLRFALPETPDQPGALNVVIESFRHSRNEIIVEVKGIFPNTSIDAENLPKITRQITQCRRFITGNVFPYLNQFDTPKEGLV